MTTPREWAESVTGRRVVASRELSGGYSNHNVRLEMSDGSRLVLRRYLRDNRCAVEAALARRLHGVVPVAEVVAADPAAGLLLSVFVDGGPVTDGYPVGVTLARIGSVSFEAPGFFGDSLTPDGMEPIGGLDAFVDRCLRTGHATGHLTGEEQQSLLRYAAEVAPELDALQGAHRLVHADYNPKNLLAVNGRVTAVLDWEFAFSSSPLFDVGNMLRDPRPPGFAEDFRRGFRDGGGELPDGWRRLSAGLDLYSLADFLTRPPEHRYFVKAVERIRELIR